MREFKLAAIVGAIIMLALPMSSKPADAIVYNLTLPDAVPPGVSGTGILEVINPPGGIFTLVNTPTAQVPVFSISIGSSVFDLSDNVTNIAFSNGNLFNITAVIPDQIPAVLFLGSTQLSFSYSLSINVENGSGFITSTVAAVPLPAALPLFATGLAALGLLAWRRKRQQQINAATV